MWTHGLLIEQETKLPVPHPDLEAYRWQSPAYPNKQFWVTPRLTDAMILPCVPKKIPATVARTTVGSEYKEAKRARDLAVCRTRPTPKFAAHLRERYEPGWNAGARAFMTREDSPLSARNVVKRLKRIEDFRAARALYTPWTVDQRCPWVGSSTIHLAVMAHAERVVAEQSPGIVPDATLPACAVCLLSPGMSHRVSLPGILLRAKWAPFGTTDLERGMDNEETAHGADYGVNAVPELTGLERFDCDNRIAPGPERVSQMIPPKVTKFPWFRTIFPRAPVEGPRLELKAWVNGAQVRSQFVKVWECGTVCLRAAPNSSGRISLDWTIVAFDEQPEPVKVYVLADDAIAAQVHLQMSKAAVYRWFQRLEAEGRPTTVEGVYAILNKQKGQDDEGGE